MSHEGLKEKFIDFLKDNDAYDRYKDNLKGRDFTYLDNMDPFFYLTTFWNDTKEGKWYWGRMDTLWKNKLKSWESNLS